MLVTLLIALFFTVNSHALNECTDLSESFSIKIGSQLSSLPVQIEQLYQGLFHQTDSSTLAKEIADIAYDNGAEALWTPGSVKVVKMQDERVSNIATNSADTSQYYWIFHDFASTVPRGEVVYHPYLVEVSANYSQPDELDQTIDVKIKFEKICF